MEVTLQASATLFALNIGGRLFTCAPDGSTELEAALKDAARQLSAARGQLALETFAQKRRRPDFWPEWTMAQGLNILIRDGHLTDQGVIRLVGKLANETRLPFSWLTWLGQTWRWERFQDAMPGLGDKRICILRDALIAFQAAHPDQLYTGRLP